MNYQFVEDLQNEACHLVTVIPSCGAGLAFVQNCGRDVCSIFTCEFRKEARLKQLLR